MQGIREILKSMNIPTKTTLTPSAKPSEPVYSCPVCQDFGKVYPVVNGRVDYSRSEPCKCQKARIARENQEFNWRYCQLPAGSDNKTFETFEAETEKHQKALAIAQELAEEKGEVKWLTLLGGVSRGKTHLAVAVCRRWLERGKVARFVVVSKLLKELRDGFDLKGEDSYRAQFDALCRVPLLVLDDLGAERATEWAQEQIYDLINDRYNAQRPLIVTTNCLLDDLPIDPSHRIASRLQRERWCQVVALTGKEHRKKEAK